MYSTDAQLNRFPILLAILATVVYAIIGYAVQEGMGEALLVGSAIAVGAVMLAFLSPAAGIAAVLLAAPTMYDLHRMPGGTFSLLELAILTSFAGIALRLVIDGIRRGFGTLRDLFTPAQVVVPALMLAAAAAITLVTLADPGHRAESLREIRTVIIEPLMFLVAARMVLRDPESRIVAGSMLVVGGTSIAIYAAAQILLDLGGVKAGDLTRATATYTHPNNLALFLERTVLFTIGVALVRPRWWPVWVLAFIQLAGVVLTFSRGALIAIVAGVALLLLVRGMYKWLLLLVTGGIGVAGVGVVLFPDRLADAGGSGAEPTRFTIWRASLRMALDHPIFGVGPDQFLYQYSRRYIEPVGWPERYTSHPHNLLLDTWLRLGVAGLAAGASLVVGLLWWARKRFADIRSDAFAMGAVAALAGGMAHGMVDNAFFLPDLAALGWFFVALLVTVPVRHADLIVDSVDVERTTMESTWPEATRTEEEPRTMKPAGSRNWTTLAMIAMGGVFLVTPFLTEHPYLPFLMIALIGLITIIDPTVGLAAVVLSVPVQEALVVPFIRNELTYTQITLFGLVLGWGVTFYRYRIWLDSIVLGFIAVFAAFSISLIEMDSPGLWFGEVYRWAAAAGVYVIARSVILRWEDIRTVLYGVAIGVIATGIDQLQNVIELMNTRGSLPLELYRAMGAFGVPNPLAAYIEFTIPVFLVFALLGFQRRLRERIGIDFWVISILTSGFGVLTLGLTQSRGGMIGMAAALAMVFFILPRRIQLISVLAGVVLVGGFILTPIGQSQLDRFEGVFEDNGALVRTEHGGTWGRASLWQAGIEMIQDKPFTGIGPGEYDYHYREYVPEWIDRSPRGQAHNGWLQMGAQAGIPGIFAFMVWLIASVVALVGAARRATDEIGHLLAWGALAVMLAFTLHSLVDYLNVLSLSIQLSAVTAIGLALAPDPIRMLQRRSVASTRDEVTLQSGVSA